MKNYLYRNLLLISLCAIFSVSVFPQKKNSDVKTPVSPASPKAPKIQLSTLELAVVDELNEARSNPQKYVGYLEEQRRALRGNIIKMPKKTDVQTIEGAAAIDEAVNDLKLVSNLAGFQVGEGLTGVARAQLADLQENSKLGHFGKDGSDLKTRMARFGSAMGKCGENICHRGNTARDVVMIFLVDDGVKERPHRKAVLSPNFKQIGVACGIGKNAESLCVVVFADSFKDKTAVPAAVEF
ncbi:MAG: CAP domain-containing protein [Pyrinomonadaceae bacterium]|nr:CAP domain-containing protein [Pyrinomonadaceae bacterium]